MRREVVGIFLAIAAGCFFAFINFFKEIFEALPVVFEFFKKFFGG